MFCSLDKWSDNLVVSQTNVPQIPHIIWVILRLNELDSPTFNRSSSDNEGKKSLSGFRVKKARLKLMIDNLFGCVVSNDLWIDGDDDYVTISSTILGVFGVFIVHKIFELALSNVVV